MAASSSKSKTNFQAKRASKNSKEFSQFPVPYDSNSNREWPQYQGVLNGFSVTVEDPESIAALYCGGYFGKGNLSRSKPGEFTHRDIENHEFREANHLDISYEEALHLTLEEAFFLSYALGCLRVREGTTELTIEDSWVRYCSLQADFIQKYVAYHYYRSNSWTVRSGIKFGADFLLYKRGPDFFHASYSVIVVPFEKQGLEGEEKLSWSDFAGVNRVTESAAKELILCHVYFPKHCDLGTPLCLPDFSVDEVILKRWVPSQQRNSDEPEED